jgi:hypothetical protein
MPLERLHSLVDTLKERIEKHGSALRGSEALTRYALIDPLLRELGWDTSDPSLVIPEYKSGNGRADYALMGSDRNPAMMIEAKSLGSSLQDKALTQGIQYCLEKGTKYFALTDGDCWEIYETHRPVPIENKRAVVFDMSAQPTAEICLQALALWQPSLGVGRATPGNATFIEPVPASFPADPIPSESITEPGNRKRWRTMSELKPRKGDSPPVEIQFPDESIHPIKYWNGVMVEVVRWLVTRGHLHISHCPISQANSSARHLVAKDPVHPTNNGFFNRKQVKTLWVETDYIIPHLVNNARTIILHVDQDPAQFKLRFD